MYTDPKSIFRVSINLWKFSHLVRDSDKINRKAVYLLLKLKFSHHEETLTSATYIQVSATLEQKMAKTRNCALVLLFLSSEEASEEFLS